MLKLTVKNLAGKDIESLELPETLFDLPKNDTLVHQVYVVLSGNLRSPIAHTKDRGERAGTGKKPWKQKGTGRARAGSVRSPLWRKGGVTFGPTKDRNFVRQIPTKMRQKATLVALSEKVRTGKMIVVDALTLAEVKTKLFAGALSALGIAPRRVVVSTTLSEKPMTLAMRNIPKATVANNLDLNVRDLVDHEYVLLSKAGVAELEKRFASWNK